MLQTLLSANQRACTILLILLKLLNRKKRQTKIRFLSKYFLYSKKQTKKQLVLTKMKKNNRWGSSVIFFRHKLDYHMHTANVYHHGHYVSTASVRGRYKVLGGLSRTRAILSLFFWILSPSPRNSLPNKRFENDHNLEHLFLLCKRIIILERTLFPSRHQ